MMNHFDVWFYTLKIAFSKGSPINHLSQNYVLTPFNLLYLTYLSSFRAEWKPNLVEIGDVASWFNHILLHNKATRQDMACPWTWLQSQHQQGRDWKCCSCALQWEHETLARHCHHSISAILDQVCGLWFGVCSSLQSWSLNCVMHVHLYSVV